MNIDFNKSIKVIILLDWIGSILMMGTLWGWIYSKISPMIKKRLQRSRRHCKALVRFLRIKYGENFEKVPAIQRYYRHNEKIGIHSYVSLKTSYLLLREQEKIKQRKMKYGLASDEEIKMWSQYKIDSNEYIKISLSYVVNKIKGEMQQKFIKIIDIITLSIFSGKIGIALFILGFIFWNISKFLSYTK